MPYDTLYSAVLGASPTLLIAYAVAHATSRRADIKRSGTYTRMALITVLSLSGSALLALNALMQGPTVKYGENYPKFTGFL